MAFVHLFAAASLLASPVAPGTGEASGQPDINGPVSHSKSALPTVGPYRCNTPTDSIYHLHPGARHTFKRLHIVSAGDGTAPVVTAATRNGEFSPATVVKAGVIPGVDVLSWDGETFAVGLTRNEDLNAGLVLEGGKPLEREAAELTASELVDDDQGRCRGAYAYLEDPSTKVTDMAWFDGDSATIKSVSNTPVVGTMFSDRASRPTAGLGWAFWVAPQAKWFSALVEREDGSLDQLHIPFGASLPTAPAVTHNRGRFDTLGQEYPTSGTTGMGSHFVQAFIPGDLPRKNVVLHIGDATYPMAWNHVDAIGGTWYVLALNPGELANASSAWMEWRENGSQETRTLQLDSTPGVWSTASHR